MRTGGSRRAAGEEVSIRRARARPALLRRRAGVPGPERRQGRSAKRRCVSGRGQQAINLVCAFEVIEHLEDDQLALEQWVAHLRPGGWLLLTTPAWQHRFGAADALVGHVRRYDPPSLREMMRSAGLTEIETRLYGGPLGYVLEVGRDLVAQLGAWVTPGSSRAERTAGSGRWLQPRSDRAGFAVRVGTAPFRRLQGVLPDTGPGLVAIARLPLT